MLYPLSLLVTVGICSWISLDLIASTGWRRRIGSMASLSFMAACWAAGELLLTTATQPTEILVGRRLLFLGVCMLPPTMLWSALQARSPGWSARHPWILGGIMIPSALIYSTLYWSSGGIFVDGISTSPRHGPLFPVHMLYAWTLILASLGILLAAMRAFTIPATRSQRILLSGAIATPLVANAVFVLGRFPAEDPTPVVLGVSALVLRRVVLDIIWGAHHMPFARGDAVEQMKTGLIIADRSGRVIDSNPAARRLLGKVGFEGHTLAEIIEEIEQSHSLDFEAQEFPLQRKNLSVGAGLAIHDRSEQRRLEYQVERATRVEALGHLASGISHEVNNPLAYLTVNLGLIEPLVSHLAECRKCGALPESIRELASEAPVLLSESREGADRIRRIINQLGSLMSTATEGDADEAARSFDLLGAIERAKEFATFGSESANIRIGSSVRPMVFASEQDVVHILIHLLMNAIREAGKNGTIEVRVSAVSGGSLVEVFDDGPGIPDWELPYLFDPLYTTGRPGRLGLGLSLCWRLAQQNNARMEAYNRAPGGAAFTLTLPSDPSDPSGEKEETTDGDLANERSQECEVKDLERRLG